MVKLWGPVPVPDAFLGAAFSAEKKFPMTFFVHSAD